MLHRTAQPAPPVPTAADQRHGPTNARTAGIAQARPAPPASSTIAATRLASIAVARAALDFRLRYRPPAEIDRARFDLWAAKVLVDAAANNAAFVRGDATALEWVRDRFAHTLGSTPRAQVDNALRDLRAAADSRDFAAAASAAARLRVAMASAR